MLSKKTQILKKQIFKTINFFENISLIKFIYFFPFIFALAKTFSENYKNKNFYFISKNIFISNKKEQELTHWETFHFFIINKITQENIKIFNLYKNILFIELKKPLDFEFFAVIKKNNISKIKKISDKYYFIQTKNIVTESKYYDNFISSNKTIFYLNDGIPKKINKMSLFKQKPLQPFFFDQQKNLYINLKLITSKKKYTIETKNNYKENNNSVNLLFTPLIQKEINYTLKKTINNPSHSLKRPAKLSIIKKTINQYFYEKNIRFYTKKTNVYYPFKKHKSWNFQKTNILKLLNKRLSIHTSNKLKKRQISGYKFLDFNKKNSLFFTVQNLKIKKTFIKTVLPSTQNLFKYSFDSNLINTFFFKTRNKNGLLGTTRQLNSHKNQIINSRNVINFQNNLKTQTKKFRKIDDFSTKTTFNLFLKKSKSLKNLKKKKTTHWIKRSYCQQSYIDFSKEFLKTDFLKKKDFHYQIKTKLSFFYSQPKYIKNWEFISTESWLFITKFILFIYIYTVLKELYKEYGKEFINYLVEYGKTNQDDFEILKEQYFSHGSSFRVIKKTKKKIRSIVGIDFILPEVGEIILNLKKATQTKQIKKTTSKGFLLSGLPGNGKTLLVQSIAGESQVPVLIQSASLLINNKLKGQSHKKLKKIFRYAKEIGPAIIFIDEIDSLGKRRNNIFNNSITNKKQFNFLNYYNYEKNKNILNLSTQSLFLHNTKKDRQPSQEQSNTIELNILTQFLIEMDGLQNQQKFILFGATNRIKTLDPAFTRPGRFDRIITLDSPSTNKRLQILKFYSKKRKIEKTISWKYLLKKTKGLTASELASIMNESTIQSILKKTTHTIETIETGINLITSYGFLKSPSQIKNIKNISYYQAGKTIGWTFLNSINKNVLTTLTLLHQKKNSRSNKLTNQINFDNKTKIEVENLLIYFHLGKASEFIFINGKKKVNTVVKNYFNVFFNQDDLKNIEKLGFIMIDKWYLYSIQSFLRKENQNLLTSKTETQSTFSNFFNQTNFRNFKIKRPYNLKNLNTSQENHSNIFCQNFLILQTTQINKNKIDWYRFYIPDPDEKIYNIEWIPPDLFLHTNSINKKFSKQSNFNFNELYEIERDYFFHSLIINSYNKALFKIDFNREWVDYFATFLLRNGILRENQINKFF